MIFIVILVFLILLAADLPALIREKNRRVLAVYVVISAVALVYMLQFTLGIEVFSPIKSVSLFVEKTLKLNYQLWQGHS